jgi:hypothetical protein
LPQPLIGVHGVKSVRDLRFDNVPFGRTQFAPTLWTKSVTVGAQSLRPPIDWDIIPTQVPKLLSEQKISRRQMFAEANANLLEVWQGAVEADGQIAIRSNYRPEQGNYRFFQARIKDFVSKNTKPAKVTV